MSFFCKKKKDSVYNDKLRGSKSSDALKPSRLPSASADSKNGTADDRPRSKHSDDGPTSTQRQSTQKGSQKGSLTPPPPSSRDAHRTSSSSSGYSYAMPAIATTASPRPDTRGSRSSSAAADAAAGTDAFLVPPRSNTAPLVTTVTPPRHSPQARVQLPALNSAHSNRSSCDSTSPAPTVVSAPPSSSKPFSGATAQGSGDLAAMAPMPRHSASEPAQSPLMGLRRVSNSTSVGRSGSGGHAGSPASPGKTPSTQAVVIAGGTTTPDAKRARAAADVAGAALTATAPTVNAVSSLSADSPPAALFSAMELVPKKTGTSFRLQKRRSSSLQPDSAAGTEMGGDAAATGAKGANSFRMSSSSNNNTSTSSIASATTGDPTRKERQTNGGGSSHGRRREPVAGFASDVVEPSPQQQQQQQRASLSTRSGSLNVPLPPPLSTENLAAHHGDKAAAVSSRPASVHGGGAAWQDGDDNIASVRRSRRSSMRLHAPPSAGSLRQSSISSTDDAPRPLTRHASTLSSGQKEALRKTPSFLSRVHTPPPSDMREIVQLRRVRRPPSRDANAAGSAAPAGTDPKNEASMASDSTIQVSSVMGEKTTANGDESRRLGSMKKPDANASPASPPPPPSAASPSVRDATSVPSSVSSSFRSAQVRPAVRALRSMASSTTSDSRVGVPAATVISGGGANHGALSPISTSFSSFTSPPSTTRPPSARSSQQRQRHDLTQKGGPSLPSESPEPAAATAAAPTTPPPPAAAAAGKRPDATRLGASSSQHLLATTGSDAVNIVASNASVFSSEAELFDYYGSFMLTAPQFNKSPARTAGSSPPPPAPSEDSVKRWGRPGKDAPKPLAVSGAEPKKVSSDVMSFVSETGSFSDVLELSPAPPTATKAPRVPPPIKPKPPSTPPPPPPAAAGAAAVEAAAPSDPVRAVRPAGRHRQVNAYVDEDDENSIFQTAKDTSMHSAAYDYFMLESEGSLKADVAESKSPAAAQKAAAPVPAKRTATSSSPAAAAAPSSAMNQLSSDDDDDDDDEEEDDEEALLQGFRPAAFDAAHDRRRGSTIVFYLGAEDSLSSLDVVVKASADTRWQSPAMLSPLSSTKRPRQADYSIVRSSSSMPTSALSGREMGSLASTQHAAATTEAVARPRVTLEPYVPLGSASSPTLHPSPDTNGAGSQSDATRRESYSLFQDSYGLQLDGSAPSLPASAAKMVRQSSLPRGAEKAAAGAAPESIFLGTTSRFAADPAKLHRPLANTFGYTNAQRQARAAAMAAGVSVEAWESSVGMDDVDDGGAEDEENEYKEVYTDENGDEWYWEEVEEEGEEEGEEEEAEEEEEGEQDDAGEAAVHKATASPQQHEGLRGGATAHPVGA